MKKSLVLAMMLAGFAATSFAAEPAFLADRHVARGAPCESCHGVKAPTPGAKVPSAACTTCHGSLDKVAERTKAKVPNPHYNHLIGTDCQECHKGHAQSVNLCGSCHNLDWKVP